MYKKALFKKKKMITIQSVKIDQATLIKGVEIDIFSYAKSINGFYISKDNNTTPTITEFINLKIDGFDYIANNTPMFLFVSNQSVAPNNRFFTLLGKKTLSSKKIFVQGNLTNESSILYLFLLLEY